MKSKKNRRGRPGLIKRAGSVLNRDGEELEISNYHTGDINVQVPVFVAPGASVMGNISAPVVVVAGMLYGIVVAERVVIDPGGQAWSDIYTTAFHLESGGKCRGWVNTLDKGTIELLRLGEIDRDDVPAAGDRPVPDEFRDAHAIDTPRLHMEPERQNLIWRQLQSELAAAQLARIEIERAFEDRLAEAVERVESDLIQEDATSEADRTAGGGASNGAEEVQIPAPLGENQQDQIKALESELNHFKLRAATCLEQLAWHKVSIAASEEELIKVRSILAGYIAEVTTLRDDLENVKSEQIVIVSEVMRRAAAKIRQLEADLTGAQSRIERLSQEIQVGDPGDENSKSEMTLSD